MGLDFTMILMTTSGIMERIFMRRILFFCSWLCFFHATLYAETMYIHEVNKTTLRTGPGTNNRIISTIELGQSVQVISKREDWSLVRTSGGKEGWVLNRYLTARIPSNTGGEESGDAENAQQTSQGSDLFDQIQSCATENETLKAELSVTKKQLEEVSGAYEALKKGASDYFKLKTSYENAEKQLNDQSGTLEILKEKLQQKYLLFFAFGAGVLLLGIIIGIIFKSGRKQSSLF